MSAVEQTLREDIGGTYGKMDFSTRDRYRHVVERLAKSGRLSEFEVAAEAVRLARESKATTDKKHGGDHRASHVGYYLIDKGLSQLEELAQVRTSFPGSLRKMASRFPLPIYLGAIALITAIVTAGLLTKAQADGLPFWLFAVTGLLSLLCASQLALAVVNWFATLFVMPQPLPRMDFFPGGSITIHTTQLTAIGQQKNRGVLTELPQG